jgi:LysR family hydrogen peroxide-inducible transcriptional activator
MFPSDRRQRVAGEERLVAGDENVGEGHELSEGVVLEHLVGQILEEEIDLFLVDVGTEMTDLPRLEGVDHGIGVEQRASTDPATGSLRIGLFPTLGPYLLPHVIPEIRRKFPQLELLLIEAKTEEIVEQLDRGDLDAGILALPIEDDALEHAVLFEEDFVLAVPADHELAAVTGPVAIDAIADQSVLLLDDGHCLREQALDVCQLAGARERSDFRSTSLETMRQMVAAGVGITLLPRLAVAPPVPPSTSVELIEFIETAPSRTVAMFWRTGSAYRSFLPELAETFRQLPPNLVRITGRSSDATR